MSKQQALQIIKKPKEASKIFGALKARGIEAGVGGGIGAAYGSTSEENKGRNAAIGAVLGGLTAVLGNKALKSFANKPVAGNPEKINTKIVDEVLQNARTDFNKGREGFYSKLMRQRKTGIPLSKYDIENVVDAFDKKKMADIVENTYKKGVKSKDTAFSGIGDFIKRKGLKRDLDRDVQSYSIAQSMGGMFGANTGSKIDRFYKTLKDFKSQKGTPEFKKTLRDIAKGVNKDFKSGNMYESLDGSLAKKIVDPSKFFDEAKQLGFDISKLKTKKDVKKALRDKVMEYHPDINKSPDAGIKSSKINDLNRQIKNSEWFEKLAFFNKDEDLKKLKRGVKNENRSKRYTFREILTRRSKDTGNRLPENFAYGSTVRTSVAPEKLKRGLSDSQLKRLGFETTSVGSGRFDDIITAVDKHPDILRNVMGENEKDYIDRKRENVDSALNARLPYLKKALMTPAVTGALGAIGGAKAGMNVLKSGAVGAGVGLAPAIALALVGQSKAKNRFFERLTPEERKELVKLLESEGKKVSQNASKASVLIGQSNY